MKVIKLMKSCLCQTVQIWNKEHWIKIFGKTEDVGMHVWGLPKHEHVLSQCDGVCWNDVEVTQVRSDDRALSSQVSLLNLVVFIYDFCWRNTMTCPFVVRMAHLDIVDREGGNGGSHGAVVPQPECDVLSLHCTTVWPWVSQWNLELQFSLCKMKEDWQVCRYDSF